MTIDLTDSDAMIFRDFQEHYSQYKVMRDNGVFDIRQGSATIHFNASGQVNKIQKDFVAFVLLTK